MSTFAIIMGLIVLSFGISVALEKLCKKKTGVRINDGNTVCTENDNEDFPLEKDLEDGGNTNQGNETEGSSEQGTDTSHKSHTACFGIIVIPAPNLESKNIDESEKADATDV